ncbi:hypothetical protein QFC21_001848 [Naganishia friedmannii]|uniref:Uncharacterized protein n=1 Tax=Naganishia friedmannii TaxID=89922 RepID=A0ACC2W303_9TREE|nr:hypothetical protein QFC21_001848 [Naganishia friedmannii]
MALTPAAAYEILKSIVAQDTVLILYDLKGVEKRMFVNLLSLKTVFGLEHRNIRFRKDEEGLYCIRINVRCTPAFIFGLNLAYTRLSHQGDSSLIRRSDRILNQKLVASLSLTGVKTILHFAEFYGMRGVYEEMTRLICNDTFLECRRNEWTGRDIQRHFTSRAKPTPKPAEGGKGLQPFIVGLSPYEEGIYLVHLEVVVRRRELKAAQLAVYSASLLEEITNKEVPCEEIAV